MNIQLFVGNTKSISNTWQRTPNLIGHGYFKLGTYSCAREKNPENALSK